MFRVNLNRKAEIQITVKKTGGGGGSPAFCRSLQQIGQCGSGKKRQKAASTIKSIAELLSAVDLSGTSNDGKITCYILVSE